MFIEKSHIKMKRHLKITEIMQNNKKKNSSKSGGTDLIRIYLIHITYFLSIQSQFHVLII